MKITFNLNTKIIILLKYLSLCTLFLSSACTNKIEHKPTFLRTNPPEISGDLLNGRIDIQYINAESRNYGQLKTDLLSEFDHDSGEPTVEGDQAVYFRGNVGLTQFMDAYARSSWNAPTIYGVKMQIFGKPKRPGWRSSLSAEYGKFHSESNLEEYLEYSHDLYDVSLGIGYRENSTLLLYMNVFYSEHKINGKLRRDNDLKYSVNGKSKGVGGLVGLEYSVLNHDRFFGGKISSHFNLEAGISNLNWLTTIDHEKNDDSTHQSPANDMNGILLSTSLSWH